MKGWIKLPALALTLVLSLVLTACGASSFATQLRVVLAAGAPVLTVLSQQGKITESFRLKLVTDLNEEAGYVSILGACFDSAGDSKPGKLRCVETFDRSTRPVLERNFRTNEKVRFIADDVESIISAALIFYGGTPVGVQGQGVQNVSEKDIKAMISKLKKDLGQ